MGVILGWLLILGGIGAGAYVGFWWCFIGGIMQIVHAVQHIFSNVGADGAAADIAFGIAKIVFAAFLGWLIVIITWIPGWALIQGTSGTRHKRY